MRVFFTIVFVIFASACARVDHIGKPPTLTDTARGSEAIAMRSPSVVNSFVPRAPTAASSLWSAGQRSLLGDQRAAKRGDILTVVIEIDERAEISNSTQRSRSSRDSVAVPQLLGIPQRTDPDLPIGATLGNAVDITSSANASGDGSVQRRERLTLRVAATVLDSLPNGILAIEGSQEVRVNFELRELLVSGYVRPEDISRQNEITYDKIASARISYGGRGQITDVQQPRIGQQILDAVLPF